MMSSDTVYADANGDIIYIDTSNGKLTNRTKNQNADSYITEL